MSERGCARLRRPWLLYLAFALPAIGGYLTLEGRWHDTAYNLIGLSALAALTAGIFCFRPPALRAWLLFAGGFALWNAGDLYYTVDETWVGNAAAFVSPADGLYFAGYALMAAGLVALVPGWRRVAWDTFLDSALVSTGVALLAWALFIDPYAHDETLTPAEQAVSAAYPVLDMLLLALLVRVAVRTRFRIPAHRFLGLFVLIGLAADVLWRGYLIEGGFTLGSWVNALFLLAYVFLGAAGLDPSLRTPTPLSQPPPRLGGFRLALLIGGALSVPIALIAHSETLETHATVVIATGTTLLFLLMLARLKSLFGAVERHAAEARLAERRALQVVDSSPAPMAVIDPRGNVLTWNEAAAELMGWSAEEVVGRRVPIVPAEDPARVAQLVEQALRGRPLAQVEVRLRTKDERLLDVVVSASPLRDRAGELTGIVVSWLDVTERKRQAAEIEYLATHDPLTDLPNRRAFQEHLALACQRSRERRAGAIVLVDMDNLKEVNDTLGHPAGDAALVSIARRLKETLRPGDFVARIGGDEFAAIVHDVSPAQAKEIAERLLRESAVRIDTGVAALEATVSAGVCLMDEGLDRHALLARADAALYEAKARGRNRAVLFGEPSELAEAV